VVRQTVRSIRQLLLVTILTPTTLDDERAAWAALSAEGLARAYGAYGDSEPEYSVADIQP
jgi:hypothetical protein